VLRARLPEVACAATVLFAGCGGHAALAQETSPCTEAQWQAYIESIRQVVSAGFHLPAHYREVDCTVQIAQSFRGEVLDAAVQDCTNPELVKLIEDAAYLASPLPLPRNESCFEPSLEVRVLRRAD